MSTVVYTVGNELRGDDGLGPLLARKLETQGIAGIELVDGGQVPENWIHVVRRLAPERVILVDAAHMQLEVGQIRIVDKSLVGKQFLMTTHTLPLSFLIESLEESVDEVVFVGVQPGSTEFYDPVSPEIEEAAARLYAWLEDGAPLSAFKHLTPTSLVEF